MWHRLLHLVTKRTSLRLLLKYLEVWFKSKHITHKFRTEVYLPSMLNDKKNMTSHGRTRHMSTMWYILRTLRDFSTYTPSLSSPQYLYLVLCWVHITLSLFLQALHANALTVLDMCKQWLAQYMWYHRYLLREFSREDRKTKGHLVWRVNLF